VGGELEVLVETTQTVTGCRRCGVLAAAHGRREHLVRDIPSAGRPVLLVWSKRLWRCAEPLCPVRTWSDGTRPSVGPPRCVTWSFHTEDPADGRLHHAAPPLTLKPHHSTGLSSGRGQSTLGVVARVVDDA
jgi:hypothetical protein